MKINLFFEGRTTGEDPEATGHRVTTAITKGRRKGGISHRKSQEEARDQTTRIATLLANKHGADEEKSPEKDYMSGKLTKDNEHIFASTDPNKKIKVLEKILKGLSAKRKFYKAGNALFAVKKRVKQRQYLGYEPPEDKGKEASESVKITNKQKRLLEAFSTASKEFLHSFRRGRKLHKGLKQNLDTERERGASGYILAALTRDRATDARKKQKTRLKTLASRIPQDPEKAEGKAKGQRAHRLASKADKRLKQIFKRPGDMDPYFVKN